MMSGGAGPWLGPGGGGGVYDGTWGIPDRRPPIFLCEGLLGTPQVILRSPKRPPRSPRRATLRVKFLSTPLVPTPGPISNPLNRVGRHVR